MKKALCLLLLAMLLLPVCALGEGSVVVYNWEDYIDPDVITLFEEETGIKVDYKNFTTNEDMIVQVEVNP
ncbi:MAG: spermidine/putrescine ABC transporter substrate-binding protein, partial [Aristaeellaceae bacterium]